MFDHGSVHLYGCSQLLPGAAQADSAVLVVNATRGEFESGFDAGGQTREHALLVRALGVGHIIVAVNKLDTVDWSEQRYNEICATVRTFLTKQVRIAKLAIALSRVESASRRTGKFCARVAALRASERSERYQPDETARAHAPARLVVQGQTDSDRSYW